MTAILGISALYHDSAAALVVDGRIIAAAQEERFTRIKHDASLPVNAIRYCLQEGCVTAADLDFVGFYEKPLMKLDRLLSTYHSVAPAGFPSFLKGVPSWLRKNFSLERELRSAVGEGYKKRFVFAEHHESHAASAFFPSPFEEAAILTVDGVGEWATAALGLGKGNSISLTSTMHFPHSLGLLYSAFTYHCGFTVNSGEYKLMGLAPYGEPRYAGLILEKLIDLKEDGSFRMDMSFFDYCQGLKMTSERFDKLFGGPPRRKGMPVTRREMDMAASVQVVAEEILLRMVRHLHSLTNAQNLCMAGGVALNCVANGRIIREGPFKEVWIQPASDDAGGALGVALLIWHQMIGNRRRPEPGDSQMGSLLGPRFDNEAVESLLESNNAKYRLYDSETELLDEAVRLLEGGKVLGWFQGRMEYGPRALGNRSILGDPRSDKMQGFMNRKIKFRESFRPFAASVLKSAAGDYFEMKPDEPAGPYMLMVTDVDSSKRLTLTREQQGLCGFDKLPAARSLIPAVTHVNCSTRVQTVDNGRHGRFYRLLERFSERTGCSALVNTSFNVRGQPIVCTPEDAYRCFLSTQMDAMIIEDYLLMREEQPPLAGANGGEKSNRSRRWLESSLFAMSQNPSGSELRLFSAVWMPLFLVAAGALLCRLPGVFPATIALWTSALLSLTIGLYRPDKMRLAYMALNLVTAPIGLAVSTLAMSMVYFFVITPVSLAIKLFGRDPLSRKINSRQSSYWAPRQQSDDPGRWFRKF
ncbi:hypothetical protein EPN96_01655 [bacterium]|nr:MAG: hypothetical protein EPN96_01655 [bacterium]